MTDSKSNRFERSIVDGLDASVDDLPASIQSELTKRRYQALEQGSQASDKWKWFAGVGAIASMVLVVLLNTGISEVDNVLLPTADNQSLEFELLLADGQDLEIAENYEFMLWLMEEENAT